MAWTVGNEAAEFVEKWLAVEPEMEVALVLAGAGRTTAALWGALLNEWVEACFSLNDAGVARAKLAWWGEALAQASPDSPHPLVRAFAREAPTPVPPARWHKAFEAAQALLMLDTAPASVEGLLASRRPLATALLEIEAVLWPGEGTSPDALTGLTRWLVVRQWRHSPRGESARPAWIPLQLLARHDLRASVAYAHAGASSGLFQDLADALLTSPPALAGARFRRIRTKLDARALGRLRVGHAQPFEAGGPVLVWHAWRAARGATA